MNNRISIIVPIYKVEKYIKECVESIVTQTYKDIEIILVDDGSPDNCGEICDEYAKKDSRIKVIHKKNGGLSDARNAGIENATGEYLLFVDSDDWIEPELCEVLLKDMISSSADIVIFGFNEVDEEYNIIKNHTVVEKSFFSKKECIEALIDEKIHNYAWNKLYKRVCFENVRFPKGYVWEDIGTTYRAFANSDKILVTNRTLYNYRRREQSITGLINKKALSDIYHLRKKRYEYINKRWADIGEKAIYKVIETAFNYYNILICDNGEEKSKKAVKRYLRDNKELILKCDSSFMKKMYYENRELYNIIVRIRHSFRGLKKTLFNIKKSMRPWKQQVKRIFRKLKKSGATNLLDEYKGTKKCFLIGTPNHDNLGDHAIADASIKFLNNTLIDYKVIEITENDYWKYATSITNVMDKEDIIVLQGGGNLGDQYMYIEELRRDVIIRNKNRKIIMFPQTIYFSDTFWGRKEKNNTKKIYNKANIIYTAREKFSQDRMQELFKKSTVKLLPDIVLTEDWKPFTEDREGILMCIRSDKEAALSYNDIKKIKDIILQYDHDIYYTDTCIIRDVAIEDREKELMYKLNQFAKSKLIITDRLHGMVFAALMKVPCVVLSNYNYKVQGVYEWINNLNYIKYIEGYDNLREVLEELLSIEQYTEYPREVIDNEYLWLSNMLLE